MRGLVHSLRWTDGILTSLINGICVCTNEQNVAALRDPTDSGSVWQTLPNGQCFVSNGGIYHSRGTTWYEVKDASSQRAWIDSYYLSITEMHACKKQLNDQSANNHIPKGEAANCTVNSQFYLHGQHFELHGLFCSCDDGAPMCSFGGQNCLDKGIIYPHLSTTELTGRGTCHCDKGVFTCTGGSQVGK